MGTHLWISRVSSTRLNDGAPISAGVGVRVWPMYPQGPGSMPPAVAMRAVPAPGVGYPPTHWGRGVSATVGVGRDDLVSGEAVALDLPAASIGLRVLSGFIDLVLGYVVLALLLWLSFELALSADGALFAACVTLSLVLAYVGVPTAVETVTRGKTLGHWIVGLRTVRDDAGPIRFRHAVTRALLGSVEIYTFFGVPALISAAINRKGKRLGDMLAGTYVIRDRFSYTPPDLVEMPPELGQWARSADLGSVPDAVASGIRLLLTRREQYTPAAREALGQRLIYAVAPYVAPAPPPYAGHESVLAAILAERRNRDAARLDREERLRQRLLR